MARSSRWQNRRFFPAFQHDPHGPTHLPDRSTCGCRPDDSTHRGLGCFPDGHPRLFPAGHAEKDLAMSMLPSRRSIDQAVRGTSQRSNRAPRITRDRTGFACLPPSSPSAAAGHVVSRMWPQSADAECNNQDLRKHWAFLSVARVEKAHGGPFRRIASQLAGLALVLAMVTASGLLGSSASAEDVIIVEEGPALSTAAGCGCRGPQQPPWHASVRGDCCNRPCCPPPNMFHADPCGQLRMRRYAREHCMEMPSNFPRLQGLWVDGRMPAPVPPALPRCHQCGAVIHHGM